MKVLDGPHKPVAPISTSADRAISQGREQASAANEFLLRGSSLAPPAAEAARFSQVGATKLSADQMGHIESAVGEFRATIQHGAPAEDIANRVQVLNSLFDDALGEGEVVAVSPDVPTPPSV